MVEVPFVEYAEGIVVERLHDLAVIVGVDAEHAILTVCLRRIVCVSRGECLAQCRHDGKNILPAQRAVEEKLQMPAVLQVAVVGEQLVVGRGDLLPTIPTWRSTYRFRRRPISFGRVF